ncbi:hypothetical protein D3C80_1407500 [compost metagenome]
MIPEFPAASYFAEGLVMSSMDCIALPSVDRSRLANCSAERLVGLPSSIMFTPCLPLRLIFPSLSTVTPGAFSNISNAVFPVARMLFSMFSTVLSI